MARSASSWLWALGAPALVLACGGSSQHESEGSGGTAGNSGAAAAMSGAGKSDSGGAAGGGGGTGGSGAGHAGMETAGQNEAGTGGSSGGAGGSSAGHGGTPSRGGAGSGVGGGAGKAGASSGGMSSGGTSSGGTSSGGTSSGAGTNGGTGIGGAAVTAINAIADTVGTYCTAVTACCNGTVIPHDDCEAMYATNQPAMSSVTTGGVTVDLGALATCKAAYGAGSDQCNLNAIVKACAGVYVGTRGVGEPCTNLYDCDRSAGAMTCVVFDPNADPVGNCQKVPHLQAGDDCPFACRAGDDCSSTTIGSSEALGLCFESDGLVCDYGLGKCANMIALGSGCTEDGQCGSEAYCDTTCKARPGLGEPCGSGASCRHELQCGDSGNCEDPSWTSSSTCAGYAPAP